MNITCGGYRRTVSVVLIIIIIELGKNCESWASLPNTAHRGFNTDAGF